MADEQNNTPRRSTRAPKPETDSARDSKQPGGLNPETGEKTGSAAQGSSKFEPKGDRGNSRAQGAAPTPVNGAAGKGANGRAGGAKPSGGGEPQANKEKKEGSSGGGKPAPDKKGESGFGEKAGGKKPTLGAQAAATPASKDAMKSNKKGASGGAQGKPDGAAAGKGKPDAKGKGDDKKDDAGKEGKEGKGNNDKADDAAKSDKAGGAKDAAKAGAADKAKSDLRGSNATGVDYSDKGLKDQLEHQAADVAMDATPILGQINAGRKALKEANKQKKQASGNKDSNDVLDKVEDGADKAVEGGIKGAKVAVGGALAGTAGFSAASALMLMKTLMFLKSMVLGVVGKIAGFVAGIVQSVGAFFSGLLGVSAAIGNAIGMGIVAVAATVVGTLGVGFLGATDLKDPGVGACLPDTKAVTEISQDYVEGGGEVALLQEENAGKLWSVYSAMGGSKEQTAAVLGNLQHESNLDPTSVETIFDEPYTLGPRKQAATKANFDIHAIDNAYGNKYPAIKQAGIGLAQWTNGRNVLLVKYAKDKSLPWHEFDTQIGFMFAGDEPARQKQLKDFLAATPSTFDVETERFMNTWIGLSTPNASLADRKVQATNYMLILERATADTAYAEGILSGLNVNRGEGNAAAGAFHHDDGCGDVVASHYAGNKAEDGTGEVPSGLTLTPWTRETLPESLKEFYVDPALSGLAWGNGTGWTSGVLPGQCVGFATSYFIQLYPDWNKDGRPGTRPFGNGRYTAGGWASHYGSKTVATPSTGSVFSNTTSSVYGHTGIVQHVFANGDILIAEQNIRGASGDANGQQYSWSWRVMKADRYLQDKWEFFKPEGVEPMWEKSNV